MSLCKQKWAAYTESVDSRMSLDIRMDRSADLVKACAPDMIVGFVFIASVLFLFGCGMRFAYRTIKRGLSGVGGAVQQQTAPPVFVVATGLPSLLPASRDPPLRDSMCALESFLDGYATVDTFVSRPMRDEIMESMRAADSALLRPLTRDLPAIASDVEKAKSYLRRVTGVVADVAPLSLERACMYIVSFIEHHRNNIMWSAVYEGDGKRKSPQLIRGAIRAGQFATYNGSSIRSFFRQQERVIVNAIGTELLATPAGMSAIGSVLKEIYFRDLDEVLDAYLRENAIGTRRSDVFCIVFTSFLPTMSSSKHCVRVLFRHMFGAREQP